MKPDGHALGVPIHHIKDYKKPRWTCKPNVEPPARYRGHHDPGVITCTDCETALLREIAVEIEKTWKPRCACGRDDCVGDCPQADMAFDAAREGRFFR